MGDELVQRPASRPVTWDELGFAQMLIEERMLPDLDDAGEAASKGDLASVLDTAIQLEKDRVLFYHEMLHEVYENDVAAVQEIIDEEKRHVLALVKAKTAHLMDTDPRFHQWEHPSRSEPSGRLPTAWPS